MSNYIRFVSQKIVKARKKHRCYECCSDIFPGEFYNRITYVYDEIYSLCFHPCCEKLAEEYRKDVGWNYYDDDGVCPLYEEWIESGEFLTNAKAYKENHPKAVEMMFRKYVRANRYHS